MTAVMPPFDALAAELEGTQLVEASAGTGKTWTLVRLALRLVLERGVPIGNLLIVTFTLSAAAELRERLRRELARTRDALHGGVTDDAIRALLDHARARLRARATSPSGDDTAIDTTLRDRSERALAEFDEAPIVTIHAFCQRALSEAAFAARLPFAHAIQAEDDAMRLAAVTDVWRRRIAAAALPPAAARALVHGRDTPSRWQTLLKARLDAPLAHERWPALDPALDDKLRALDAAFARTRPIWAREGEAARSELPKLANGNKNTPKTSGEAFEAWQRYFAADDAAGELNEAHAKRFLRSTIDAGMAKLRPLEIFGALDPLFDLRHDAVDALARERTRLQRAMLAEAAPALEHAKAAQRVLTFQDLLSGLRARLAAEPALVDALRRRYPAALIDEFQDTDALQLDIFRTLYRGTNACVFFVGDPKQAIYAFRNADLASYLAAREDASQRFTLRDNHRAQPALIDALNALYARNDGAFGSSALHYHPVQAAERTRDALHDDRDDPASGHAAPLSLWHLPASFDGAPLSRPGARRLALRACALDIARQLRAGHDGTLRLGTRGVRGGDIAVLVERHVDGTAMRDELAALGVASVELSRASVWTSAEADELAQLLHAIADPGRTDSLRAALATELMGYDATTIAATRDTRTDVDPEVGAADAAATLIERTTADFVAWRARWLGAGIAPMLARVFEATELARRALARPDGERRLTNLLHLMELLDAAAQTRREPRALLRWFDAQRASTNPGDETLLRLESDRHLVQIVTTHAAKGLEYPIVYLPLLWHQGAKAPRRDGEPARYHDDTGALVLDFEPSLSADAKARQRRERQQEQLRLIYVALTRAVHRVVLVVDAQARRSGGPTTNESLRSGLNWVVAGGGQDFDDWGNSKKMPRGRADQIARAWAQVARSAPHAIHARELDALPPPTPAATDTATATVVLHQAVGPIAASWFTGSFSAFMQGAATDEAAGSDDDASQDHDQALPTTDDTTDTAAMIERGDDNGEGDEAPLAAIAIAAPLDADDILHFPRGAAAGDAVHALLERADFTRPDTWPRAARSALALHPQPRAASSALQPMLLRLVADLAASELQPGLRLASITPAQRLAEVPFDLPVHHARLDALRAHLHTLGLPTPRLGLDRFHGLVRGFIDLVFEHDGRYYLADWKSNHLGPTASDYALPKLERAIAAHGYHLQHALYAVALRRHLQRCLGAAAAGRAWGGAFVLFVRGIRPAWRDAQGRSAGVYFKRIEPSALDAIGALFDHARADDSLRVGVMP